MKELFPELKGVNRGTKQHWMLTHLDYLPMLLDLMGFDELCKATYSAPEVLEKYLRKAEQKHRPTRTGIEKNKLEIEKVRNSVEFSWKELRNQAEILGETAGKVDNLLETQIEIHEIEARLHHLASNSNFTEHI